MEEILRLIKGEVCMGTYGLVELELRKLVEAQKSSQNRPIAPVCDWCGKGGKLSVKHYHDTCHEAILNGAGMV